MTGDQGKDNRFFDVHCPAKIERNRENAAKRHTIRIFDLKFPWIITPCVMLIEREEVADLCVKNDISRLPLFGSAARNQDAEDSDIDLIADFSAPKA